MVCSQNHNKNGYKLCAECAPPAPQIREHINWISVQDLNSVFPLFLESARIYFKPESRNRAGVLGFKSPNRFNRAIKKLAQAGWVIVEEKNVFKRWNLERVAPEWIRALEDFEHLKALTKR